MGSRPSRPRSSSAGTPEQEVDERAVCRCPSCVDVKAFDCELARAPAVHNPGTTMARASVVAALGGLLVSLTLLSGCGGSSLPCTTGAPSCGPPITNPGSSVTNSGSPVSTPVTVQCESLSPGGTDATEM